MQVDIGKGHPLSVAAPELERRIAALVSSGQEDVSFSQTQARLREWLNRRRVNKSVGQIPKLEQELSQVEEQAEALSALCGEIARLEEAVRTLERERMRSPVSAAAVWPLRPIWTRPGRRPGPPWTRPGSSWSSWSNTAPSRRKTG